MSNKSKLLLLQILTVLDLFTVKLGHESDEHEGGEVGSTIVTAV